MRRNARTVLVVEDDYLQAQEIGRFIRGTGGEVLGPIGTVRQAASLIPHAQAAVLDIDLSGELVFPLADQLIGRGVPIVFYTGWTNTAQMPRRFWGVPLVRKPIQNIKDAAIVALTANTVGTNEDIKSILPKLRVAARLIYLDPIVADRLIERLLKDAISYVGQGHQLGQGDAKVRWLLERMRIILQESRVDLMN